MDTSPAQKTDAGGEGAPSDRQERLDALGIALAEKRTEAIQGREASGIEQQWLEDQEFYEGIDDANRHEHASAWRTKPPGQADVKPNGTRSTVFVNITAPYCDIAAARFADMVLPSDEANFKFDPPPNPELIALSKGELPPMLAQQVQKEGAQQQVATATQQALAMVATARAKADKAQKRVETWHIEGQWHAEVRRVIEDAARLGAGVLKGPFPSKIRAIALVDGELIIRDKINPKSRRVDCWNAYPDPACGDDIHNGSYFWERDHLTRRQLSELKGTVTSDGKPLYIDAQIDRCLAEGAQKPIAQPKKNPDSKSNGKEDKRFEIWYFYGFVEKEDMAAAGCGCEESKVPSIPALVTMVNGHVIGAALNPLDTGDFPYDIMPWRRKDGSPWGDGIARQIRTPQRMVNAGTRNMMDNGGLSAGVQIVFKPGVLTPVDGQQYTITPNKVWILGEDAEIDDVNKAMAFFEVPNRQAELMAIVQFGLKMAEDVTGLPMLLQGQQGKAPDTVGGMTMLNNNATSGTRRIARTFDDCVTEPHVRREYAWLLQYGEDDEEKGEFVINARASSALVERDMQAQHLDQLLPASLNPVYKLDPAKTMTEKLKSLRYDPANFQYDDDKWEKIVANMAQKPGDPRVQVETIKAQAADQRLTKEQQFEADQKERDRQNAVAIEMIQAKLDTLELDSVEKQVLEKLKTSLAETGIKVSAQKELSAASLAVDIHKHHVPAAALPPPTEPAGRAQPGQSFQQ